MTPIFGPLGFLSVLFRFWSQREKRKNICSKENNVLLDRKKDSLQLSGPFLRITLKTEMSASFIK
ncbi:hypothetical protein ACQKD9_25940 [Bacillus paramycoides]|uniref:hypothetical protein n=1 Tax=Bacillus paramycoides TaxID=2026194 RepID=UPI003D05076E